MGKHGNDQSRAFGPPKVIRPFPHISLTKTHRFVRFSGLHGPCGPNFTPKGKLFWDGMGKGRVCHVPLHIASLGGVSSICSQYCPILTQDADLWIPSTQDILSFSQNFPLFPMNSRVIPFLTKDEAERKQGQLKTPNRHYETAHTGNRLHPI